MGLGAQDRGDGEGDEGPEVWGRNFQKVLTLYNWSKFIVSLLGRLLNRKNGAQVEGNPVRSPWRL